MPREEEIRAWMVRHVAEHTYPDSPNTVDATALYEAFLSAKGIHDRPPHDEDHPAFWLAIDVAVSFEEAMLSLKGTPS
jgi:hypothetical protein